MKRKNILCMVLCCLLLFSVPVTGWAAATGPATEAEIMQSLQNSQRLSEIMGILRLNSDEAKQQLLKVTEELAALKQSYAQMEKDFVALKKAHEQLTDSYSKMTTLSQKQDELLTKINSDFETYSKETKAKIRSLEIQRTLLSVGLGGALIWGAIQAFKTK